MREATFGRGQVEWALWRCFTISIVTADIEAPKSFLTRIKRLLEIDRGLDLGDAEVPPQADYAFAPPPSDESGETAYSAVDAFCLAIALDLLDAGFKQAEIVFLMRYLRPELHTASPGPPSGNRGRNSPAQDGTKGDRRSARRDPRQTAAHSRPQ